MRFFAYHRKTVTNLQFLILYVQAYREDAPGGPGNFNNITFRFFWNIPTKNTFVLKMTVHLSYFFWLYYTHSNFMLHNLMLLTKFPATRGAVCIVISVKVPSKSFAFFNSIDFLIYSPKIFLSNSGVAF